MVVIVILFLRLLKKFIYFIFRERGREGQRAGEKHQCAVATGAPPTGDLAHNPGVCPDWESNRRHSGFQAGTQCTEPHQPGWLMLFVTSLTSSRYLRWHSLRGAPTHITCIVHDKLDGEAPLLGRSLRPLLGIPLLGQKSPAPSQGLRVHN